MNRLALVALMGLALSACSRSPVKLTEKEETDAIVHEVRAAIMKDLSTRKDLRGIEGVELVELEEDSRDSKKIVYRIVFASGGKPHGDVVHGLDATASVVRTGENAWKIVSIEPREQKMIFATPPPIIIEKRKRR